MEWISKSVILSILFLLPTLLLFLSRRRKTNNLPPGPPGWPIFGNMFDLGSDVHISLANFREKFGPVIWLRLGAVNTMVILSAKAATELYKNYDLIFVDRPIAEVLRAHDYYKGSVAFAPYGAYLRLMRRLTMTEMLSVKRVNETVPVRRKCLDDMIKLIEKEAQEKRAIEVAHYLLNMMFNMVGNMVLSRDVVNTTEKEAMEFFAAMEGIAYCVGRPNSADFMPWLRWLDPQGLRRKMNRNMEKAIAVVSRFVKERVKERLSGRERNKTDILDVILDYEGDGKELPAKISDAEIYIVIMELFIASTEMSSSTVEWALTELLRHPDAMTKVKAELDRVVGSNKDMEESDIDNLHYLSAVVKETFRLHPPGPLTLPRLATTDTNFMGYDIPKGTQLFVNAWAIGRDPDAWENPSSFMPERFLDSKIDYRGQHYEFIPFGAGRRICVGITLAHRNIHLILGSLIHLFDWELEKNVTPDTIDMRDRLGVSVRKFVPLTAIPTKRTLIS